MKKLSIPPKLSLKKQLIINLICLILCVSISLTIWRFAKQNSTTTTNKKVTKDMLAKKNGRDGEDCWVAVDGQVYDVSASPQWSNGSHIPSNNLAYCGVDGSAVIGKAPHGRDIMKSWPKVGQYVQ